MKKITPPVIHQLSYSNSGIEEFNSKIRSRGTQEVQLLLDYPTVYIVHDEKKTNNFSVYIGETSDIVRRTQQHLNVDVKIREDWENLASSGTAQMFVIGHEIFNKSLTLDIENRLMLYMSSVRNVKAVYNRRTNQQNMYYTSNELDSIFSEVWRNLRKKNKELFPVEKLIRDSAVFKASPFHKLTDEQIRAKDTIMMKIIAALSKNETGQLILVTGEAGSGKTVLMSSLFYDLKQFADENPEEIFFQNLDVYLIVNHDQQLKVYEQIAQRLGLVSKKNKDIVSKPTRFINQRTPREKVDVVIIDEAHLLWTQGKQSYRGNNQLFDILERAKVVVAVFDQNQVLTREQYWEETELLKLEHESNLENNLIYLSNQLRINSDSQTMKWIRDFIDKQVIYPFHKDKKGYDLKIFNSPKELHEAIIEKAKNKESGISRVVATFDWEYIDKKSPNDDKYWNVNIGNWKLPWNLQLPSLPGKKQINKTLSWAEQEQTINEVGSTFTIQGFDLNYAGVIIGPSVKYRNGKIIFDAKESKNKKATQRRSLKDGTKESFSDILLKNELNVLLTRGVNGLYIFAVDKELQEALINATKGV